MYRFNMRVKFGCDMGLSFPAYENLTFEVLRRLTSHGGDDAGALPERRNCLIFRFLAELAFESSTDCALHRGEYLSPLL